MATTEHNAVRARARIGPGSSGMLMTPEEFDALPESAWSERFRYEVIHGVLIVTPPVGSSEVDPNEELGHLLRTYRDMHPDGSLLDVTMPERTVPTTENRRRCDRAIWIGLGRLPDEETEVPTIVVEFVSGAKRDIVRDYVEKRDEYRAAGVREYWIIDRFRRIMTVYKAAPEGTTTLVVAESDSYQTDLLPGFVLPLSRLLARADAWPRKKRTPRPPKSGAD